MTKRSTFLKRQVIDALKNLSLAMICCVLAAPIAPAQSINGRITGTISDQAGAVISNAAVTVTNEGTGAQRRVKANENGLYVAPELPVGFYSLKVEGGSFTPSIRTRVKVDVGAETRVDVTLTPHATIRLLAYIATCLSLPVLRLKNDAPLPHFSAPAGVVVAVAATDLSVWLLSNSPPNDAFEAGLAAASGLRFSLCGANQRRPISTAPNPAAMRNQRSNSCQSDDNSFINAFASRKSTVSNPSENIS